VMLNIRGVGLLARLLGTNPRNLSALVESAPKFYEDLVLTRFASQSPETL
jgi:hypothetical protein